MSGRAGAGAPDEAHVVRRLNDALASCQDAVKAWADRKRDLILLPREALEPAGQVRTRLGQQVLPAIETWLAEADAYVRIATSALPAGPGHQPTNVLPPASIAPPALPPPGSSTRR
ncbi:hypothetical protein ACM01_16010 [Streptomyces viridochromogenes]|uniref:Uncharacterized protein n=1 Tax=Streptomyces viridochromogenes TaxID=1938 RepID=A0A0J8C8B5_STRVR|nr:hypothetical protein [Streptomyces viridochromogenes]KMS74115.1 hypothetical protein ACM01_16010 [Streptomyces viridochromogenes]